MPLVTVVFGLLLIALGAVSYTVYGGEDPSVTALIPAFFGIVFVALGAIAFAPRARKHAMHAAAGLGLLAAFGSARGLPKLPALLQGEDLERPAAVGAQSIMFGLAVAFIVACGVSFMRARAARKAG